MPLVNEGIDIKKTLSEVKHVSLRGLQKVTTAGNISAIGKVATPNGKTANRPTKYDAAEPGGRLPGSTVDITNFGYIDDEAPKTGNPEDAQTSSEHAQNVRCCTKSDSTLSGPRELVNDLAEVVISEPVTDMRASVNTELNIEEAAHNNHSVA